MRLGYANVIRYPAGYIAWKEQYPDLQVCEEQTQRLQPDHFFPPCLLTVSDRQQDFSYLEMTQPSANFLLADVPAEFVLLKYYSEHCSQCVQEAQLYNRLFAMIQEDPGLRERLKLIGIGVGDSQRSVLRFKRTHNVPYPLLADERRILFDSVGGGEIPLIYLVRILPDSRVQVVYYHEGHIEDLGSFFDLLNKMTTRD
ncbi:Peroxiredoxin [Desulfonatronum thiosulfatophilum]|uniref:Peroxiredoxin n=1 Tax=Desulfonatronum thiosulfatophilum TaxID=617002 RepID=A0A1G6AMT5_9BACT|nr:Peroxiredoxin [Desulfonatronum thiosulfatophilum]